MTNQLNAGEPRLVTAGLGKQFGDDWAVEAVSIAIDELRVIGLIGPSGSGKTTLVRMLNGALAPDAGTVRLLGKDPREFSHRERQRIGYLPQQPVLFPELSLWENLNFHASLAGVRFRRRRRLHELLDFVDLGSDRRKKVGEASGGMQRRLALAATLVHQPAVLFLDEPTAGIDPILRRRIWDRLRELRDTGTLLVVTTQVVSEAVYCDDVGVLSDGRLLSLGPPDDLARSAYGGEVLEISTSAMLSDALVAELQSFGEVRAVERPDNHTVRLVVEDAAGALQSVTRWLSERSITDATVDQPATDFDEVFVRVVERARAGSGAGEHEAAGGEAR